MISSENGEKIAWATVGVCVAFFIYLIVCGFMNIQPFTTHGYGTSINITCDSSEKQVGGYCQ